MSSSVEIIANLNTELKDKDNKLSEMSKYVNDLESIIGRQHDEMSYMREELKIRGCKLNKKSTLIEDLKGKCKESDTRMCETKMKLSIILRKVRELEEEVERNRYVI
tara:strand:+ start:527 stop:847 length:321 start_codon:yes stop_codon:yes gene_type:complete